MKEQLENNQVKNLKKWRDYAVEHPKAPVSLKWALDVFILHGILGERIEQLVAPACFIVDNYPEFMQESISCFRDLGLTTHAQAFKFLPLADGIANKYATALRLEMEYQAHPGG